ncbi:kunitz-type serine protease inhibitor A [Aphomia sociella]
MAPNEASRLVEITKMRQDCRHLFKLDYQTHGCIISATIVRLHARHKTCFLRPDTGPCRADIVQWYFDVKQRRCYRFFWGGCQGNGNRFETKGQCNDYCYINSTDLKPRIPFFCSLAFDYGNCFGYYNRWAWDKYAKTCKRRLYSGCGGNQNNFESRAECIATCLTPPNNTLSRFHQYTTCVPFSIDELN